MANIFDVTKYFLEQRGGGISHRKLHLMAYYAQVNHIVNYGQSLFDEDIEVWDIGIVIRELYNWGRGEFICTLNQSLIDRCSDYGLKDFEKETLQKTMKDYKGYTAQDFNDSFREDLKSFGCNEKERPSIHFNWIAKNYSRLKE